MPVFNYFGNAVEFFFVNVNIEMFFTIMLLIKIHLSLPRSIYLFI